METEERKMLKKCFKWNRFLLVCEKKYGEQLEFKSCDLRLPPSLSNSFKTSSSLKLLMAHLLI